MGVLKALRKKVRNPGLHECRNCGEEVQPHSDECPFCDSQEIAHYDL